MAENSIEDMNTKSILFVEALQEACGSVPVGDISHNLTWESLEMTGTKPPKEKFESLYLAKVKAIPLMQLRQIRDRLLAESDKYATSDYPHATPEIAERWKKYRQELRDLPGTVRDPSSPNWPEVPK